MIRFPTRTSRTSTGSVSSARPRSLPPPRPLGEHQKRHVCIITLAISYAETLTRHRLSLFLLLSYDTVDGCEPAGPTALRSPSHQASIPRPAQSLRSPQNQSPPTTTLLQNILQQSRGPAGSIYSVLQRAANGQPGTTNTSPLPPSPADSGVSDVDSHYSSNDEQQQQQQQQLNQYGYFYPNVHRSTCKFLPIGRPVFEVNECSCLRRSEHLESCRQRSGGGRGPPEGQAEFLTSSRVTTTNKSEIV